MVRPPHEVGQAESLAWLAAAHAESEAGLSSLGDTDREAFRERMGKLIERCACGSDRIARRASVLADFTTTNWDAMEIYDLRRHPRGQGMGARTRAFAAAATEYVCAAYATEDSPPADLIHVTCTGYASPSAAQLAVERRGWGAITRVTHAYHMGCYAALPALRMARGFVLADDTPDGAAPRVDIVHTELCSLHFDPAAHTLEQLVVQSLFGDGFIRYSVSADDDDAFEVLAVSERIVPDSADAMAWIASDHGMQMTLTRDVPARIAAALRAFVLELYAKAELDFATELSRTTFAVHPGGPKIVDQVCQLLELRDEQVGASRDVLHDCGNMSSATLPHVWMRILADPRVRPGTPVLSLAFGPGLTLCGSLFVKR